MRIDKPCHIPIKSNYIEVVKSNQIQSILQGNYSTIVQQGVDLKAKGASGVQLSSAVAMLAQAAASRSELSFTGDRPKGSKGEILDAVGWRACVS
jgi:hypothetical protein